MQEFAQSPLPTLAKMAKKEAKFRSLRIRCIAMSKRVLCRRVASMKVVEVIEDADWVWA